VASGATTREQSQTKLWSCTGGAWIEVSPRGLLSADVVLHIPGVITLPMRCRDDGGTLATAVIGAALNSMRCVGERWVDAEAPAPADADDLYARTLKGLGAPVVPVLYVAHTATLPASTTSTVDAIGPYCIVAEGVGERDAAGCQPDDDVGRSDTRLHRIRRSIMLFDAAWHDKVRRDVDLATAQAPLPFGDVAAPYPTGSRLLCTDKIAAATQ
jgi:hypothetical protein